MKSCRITLKLFKKGLELDRKYKQEAEDELNRLEASNAKSGPLHVSTLKTN